MYFRNCWAKYESENFEKHATVVPYQRDDAKLLHFFGKFVFFTQAHLGPCQTSMVELYVKIVNNFYFQINWRRKPFFSRRYFLVNFVKFLRPALLHNTFRSQLALLEYVLTRSYIMLKTNKPQVSMFDHFSIIFLKGFWEWMRNVLVMFLMGLFSLRSWDCLSLLNWIGVPTKSQKLKLPSKKFEP